MVFSMVLVCVSSNFDPYQNLVIQCIDELLLLCIHACRWNEL